MPGLIDFSLIGVASSITPPVVTSPIVNIPPVGGSGISIINFSSFELPADGTEALIIKAGGVSGLSGLNFKPVEITINRSVNEFPTCSCYFFATDSQFNSLGLSIYQDFVIFNIPFQLDNIEKNTYLDSSLPEPIHKISLSFISKYAARGNLTPLHELDQPVSFPRTTTNLGWGNINSRISTTVLLGSSRYQKYYQGDADVELTPRSELEAAALLSPNSVLIYSSTTGILGVNFNEAPIGINLNPKHIIDEVLVTNFKSPPEYDDTEVQLEDIPVVRAPEVVTRWEFENATDMSNVRVPYTTFNDATREAELLKDPGNVFDNGGKTKTWRIISEIDGQPTSILERVYGYIYNMRDFIAMPDNALEYKDNDWEWPIVFQYFMPNPVQYWKIVQETFTVYHYDSEGYLINTRKTGWKAARLKRETGEYETVTLVLKMYKDHYMEGLSRAQVLAESLEGPPEGWKAAARNYNAYTFFNQAIISGSSPVFAEIGLFATQLPHKYTILEDTRYFIAPLRDYYSDIPARDSFNNPKFVYRQYSYSASQEIEPNPKDDSGDPSSPYPPLVISKERKDLSTTEILIPRDRLHNKKTPEIHVTTTYSQSIEGDFSVHSLAIGSRNQLLGRPSEHTKINTMPSNNPPSNVTEIQNNRYFVSGKVLVTNTPTTSPESFLPSVGTSGSRNYLAKASTSFSGACTPQAARAGARASLIREYINNFSYQIRIPFEPYAHVSEGTKITVNGTELFIKGVSFTLQLIDTADDRSRYFCKEGIQLDVVPIKPVSVSLSRRSI